MVKQVFSGYHVRIFTGGSWNSVYNFGRIGAVHHYVKIKNKWIQYDNKIFHEMVKLSKFTLLKGRMGMHKPDETNHA